MIFLLIGFCFIAVIVALVVAGHAKAEARRKLFAEFAAAQGWQFHPQTRRGLEKTYPAFELFGRGSNRHGENFLTGFVSGHPFTAFDYHYQVTSGTGENRHTHHHYFSVIMMRPGFPLKPLTIRNETVFDRLTSAFGWGDIDFESAEFSRRYHVSAPDRRWAFDVLTPRTIEFLLARNPPAIHMDHLQIMLPLSRVVHPSQLLPACATALGVLEGIPEFARHSRS